MKLYLKCIIIFIIYQPCLAQSGLDYNLIDLKWKKEAMITLSERYMRYKENHDLKRKINSEIDLYIKFNDINRYPFGKEINKLRDHLKLKKVVFDSIICIHKQTSNKFDNEALDPNNYFVFKHGKIIKYFFFRVGELKISEHDGNLEIEKIYNNYLSKTDEDFFSLLMFTKINPNWKFEICKIVINSYLTLH